MDEDAVEIKTEHEMISEDTRRLAATQMQMECMSTWTTTDPRISLGTILDHQIKQITCSIKYENNREGKQNSRVTVELKRMKANIEIKRKQSTHQAKR